MAAEEPGRQQSFECKWGKAKAKIPVAFAKAYPDAKWELIEKRNYLVCVA